MLGLGADRLRADMNRLLALLFHQGVLDEQFLQLQQLQDETSPNFVCEVVNIYFHESEKLLRNLRGLLMERDFPDYKKMGIHLNQFMGSSSSIGAKRVRNVCVAFRAASEQNNRAGWVRPFLLWTRAFAPFPFTFLPPSLSPCSERSARQSVAFLDIYS
ncbi:hypothetical protein CIPAW_01G248000 [Carya illinoinensis]|uniref:Histidine-containing phosphotransfer protein n=1 Tax=Carya illinoinensis TaxID=32201 RepID=A0A8T1RQP2_CARIL|nr:hypothetical protein CIPAW_01G248000 [Carya illinoinensis]